MVFASFPVGFGGQLFPNLGQVVLAVSILHVGSEFSTLTHQRTMPTEQVAGGAHLCGIDLGLGHHPAAQQHRNLMGINFIVLGFAAVNRLHREGMAQDKGNPFPLTEIREPLPGKHALHRHYETVAVGGNGAQKRLGRGRQIFVDEFGPVLTEDTDVHGFRM